MITNYRDQTGVCGVMNLKAKSPDTHLIPMWRGFRRRRIPSRNKNLAAKCEWLQMLWQPSKRSFSPGDHV